VTYNLFFLIILNHANGHVQLTTLFQGALYQVAEILSPGVILLGEEKGQPTGHHANGHVLDSILFRAGQVR
jgi:hypothetical protein